MSAGRYRLRTTRWDSIPKRKYADETEDIEKLEQESVTVAGVVRNVPHEHGDRAHTGSIIYVSSDEGCTTCGGGALYLFGDTA